MAGTELAKAYVQIIPSADGIKGKLTSALSGEASSAGDSAGKTAGASLGSSIKKVIAAAGIGAALKSALSEGADLQQSLGGIETLFKDSADKVIANAQNAYKTAGLSANDYMESVTSFSASLLQGLAGDTNKAADVADMALTDMSDNANKMGTSMELIQNAYQGFAKQNYTMLDNLKLGYGGTRTEMERLLADASKLSGVEYDTSNLSDVYEAIHVIQEEMGITGTTAKEAASTFSGSLASMKASVSNLLGNLSLGEDIKPAMDALISSTGTFLFDNLFPMVGNILTGLVDYIVDIMVNTDWISVITQMLTAIKDALVVGIETYFGADASMFSGIFDSFINNIPVIAQTIQGAFSVLWEGVQYIWESVGVPIFDAIMSVVQFVSDNWGTISGLFKDSFQVLWEGVQYIWESVGVPIFDAIMSVVQFVSDNWGTISGLFKDSFQVLWEGVQYIWESVGVPIFDAIMSVVQFVSDNWGTISGLFKDSFQVLWDSCSVFWESIGKPIWDAIGFAIGEVQGIFAEYMPLILEFVQSAMTGIQDTWENHLKPAFEAIGNFLNTYLKPAFEFVFDTIIRPLVDNAFRFIVLLWNDTLKPVLNGICDFLTGVFSGDWELAFNSIGEIVTDSLKGIKNAFNSCIEFVKDVVGSGVTKLKEFFKFDWELPDIKLPHFSIQPAGWELGDLLQGSIPSLGINWYAKGGIMEEPTVFGMNGNRLMVGGEAGAEAIAPIDVLQGYVAQAVASQNTALVAVLQKILDAILSVDENMGVNLRDALENTALELNHREFARLVKAVN